MMTIQEARRKAWTGIRIHRWKHPSIRCHLWGLVQGVAEIVDGCVSLLSLGLLLSNFEMQVAYYRGFSHHLLKRSDQC